MANLPDVEDALSTLKVTAIDAQQAFWNDDTGNFGDELSPFIADMVSLSARLSDAVESFRRSGRRSDANDEHRLGAYELLGVR